MKYAFTTVFMALAVYGIWINRDFGNETKDAPTPSVPVYYGNSDWAGKYLFTDDQWFEGSIEPFDDGRFKEQWAGCSGWWATTGTWRNQGDELFLNVTSGEYFWDRARTHFRRASGPNGVYLLPADWESPNWAKEMPTERGYLKLKL